MPGIVDGVPDHRLGDAVLVGSVAEGKAAFNAGVTVIGIAALVRNHAHQLVTFHLRLERAAHAAIGTGGDHAVLGLAGVDHALFHQCGGGAGLHAGTARDTLGIHERIVLAGSHLGVEAAAFNGQRKGALHFLTSAHAAGTDNALAGVEAEVGVGIVHLGVQMVLTLEAIAHLPQAHGAGHVLQLAIAVGRAGQAVQRVVRDVQLHDVAPQLRQFAGLGGNSHAL